MSAHTPGPWKVESVFPKREEGHTFDPRVWIVGNDVTLGRVRLADIPDEADVNDEQMANARLIAAAPRMLAALRNMEDALALNLKVAVYDARNEARAILRDVEGSNG